MRGIIPTNRRTATVTTSATPGLLGATTLIAAPGVNFALRILSFAAWLSTHATTPMHGCVVNMMPRDVTATNWLPGIGLTYDAQPSVYLLLPDPGIQLGRNESLDLEHASTVPSTPFRVHVVYMVDQVQ